jgi:phosphoribosylformylglycinamidine synthase I
MKPRTLILRTAGTNCDAETAHAFNLAGSAPEAIHLNRLIENPRLLDDFQLLAIPGGFSYGDDIAAGRIFANQIAHHLQDAFRRFIDDAKPIIGICNGFQVLVKTELLPGPVAGRTGQTCTLTNNASHRFTDTWISLLPHPASKCIWTRDLVPDSALSTARLSSPKSQHLELPVAHGEGRFVAADDSVRRALWDGGHVALTYTPDSDPNGSTDHIAGICDATGLVFGLMPHPERYVLPYQHPAWTRQSSLGTLPAEGRGLQVFRNAVCHVADAVGQGV